MAVLYWLYCTGCTVLYCCIVAVVLYCGCTVLAVLLPSGYTLATQRVPSGYPLATQWLPNGYPVATLRLPSGPKSCGLGNQASAQFVGESVMAPQPFLNVSKRVVFDVFYIFPLFFNGVYIFFIFFFFFIFLYFTAGII